MAVYACSVEGVEKLNNVSNTLKNSYDTFSNIAKALQSACDDRDDVLGPHKDTIDEIIAGINNHLHDSSELLTELSKKIDELVVDYTTIIENGLNVDGESLDDSSVKSTDGSSSGLSSGSSGTSLGGSSSAGSSDGGSPSPEESFETDMNGIKDTLSLSDGDSSTVQKVGPYKDLPSSKDYERHHIPSKAALAEFGIDTDKWPCICLENEDHKKTDSFRGKQKRKTDSFLPGSSTSKRYKEETIDMIGLPGGLSDLVRDEIYNIRAACGDKYDKAIGEFIDALVEHVKKNGVPKK